MWSFNRILVPTDFGKASEAALDAAIGLAKKFDGSIVLMHAYQIPVYPYSLSAPTPVDLVEHIQKGAEKELALTAARHGDSGIAIKTSLRAGSPWEEVLRAAQEHHATLIVIGSRGLRGLPRALLGSTAERVVRYASVPVLTLHAPLPETDEDRAGGVKAADGLVDRWLI
jgi:nucleotide-binding universal stress UspA family protein